MPFAYIIAFVVSCLIAAGVGIFSAEWSIRQQKKKHQQRMKAIEDLYTGREYAPADEVLAIMNRKD